MQKLWIVFLSVFILFSCSNARSFVRMNILPDIDYPVYKQRQIKDDFGNIIKITLLGCTILPNNSVNVYIIWEMKEKLSEKYKITFLEDGSNGEFFIRTASEQRIKLSSITRGPVSPDVRMVRQGDCGLVTLNFKGFNPVDDSPFDLVEGGRLIIDKAAYKNYIKDPVHWTFLGCIAGKRSNK